jgi:hypothetical protein
MKGKRQFQSILLFAVLFRLAAAVAVIAVVAVVVDVLDAWSLRANFGKVKIAGFALEAYACIILARQTTTAFNHRADD